MNKQNKTVREEKRKEMESFIIITLLFDRD